MKAIANKLVWTIICLVGLLQAQRSYAEIYVYRDSLQGPFTGSPFMMISDPNYALSGVSRKIIRNTVALNVLDNVYIATSFTYTVSFTVVYYTYSAPTTPVTVSTSLTVNYVPGQGAKYKGLATYAITNAYNIQVTVNSQTGSPPAGSIQLSSEIIVDGVYPITVSAPVSPTYTLASNGKQLNVSWNPITGADEYDVEWTTINDGNNHWTFINANMNADSTSKILDTLAIVFRNNTSRLKQSTLNCSISLNSTDSLLLVRVRQVHYTSLGIRQPGNWDYSTHAVMGSPWAIFPVTWSEASQNWQYSAAYAEQGKKKEVISYFDGTLRGRQTVTLDNTDQVAIAQENVYDYFGRPSASILPSPFKDTGPGYLHYIPLFNVAHANTPYSYTNVIGTTPGICEFNPDTLDNIAGASQYYSKANQFITANLDNRYIPDAAGFPLSVTQYTGDNTGRIKSQGGVGFEFQPGKFVLPQTSKTTKYYYGKPQQWELDQLFANDAGYAEHYLKNIVIDPNGQVSMSYLNASGKTVATALGGPVPGNVDPLPSYAAGALTYSRLLKPTDFTYNATALSLTANTTLLESSVGTDTLKFNMKKIADLYPGGTFSLCSNCFYQLTAQVSDDCGNVVATMHDTVGSSKRKPMDTLTAYNNSVNVNIGHPGEYNVNITLAYDKNVIQAYADTFVTQSLANTYLTRQFDYIKKRYLDSLDITGCYNDCHTCEMTIGLQSDFVAMLKAQFIALSADTISKTGNAFSAWANTLYINLKTHCNAITKTCTNSSPCAQQENMMLADVSPGGQYAVFSDSTGTRQDPGANAIADTLSGNPVANWRMPSAFPVKLPSDPTWKANEFTLPNGTVTSPNDGSFTLANLIAYWNPTWAYKFLPYHPEYCQLQFCENHQAYIAWDQYVQQTINTADSVVSIPTGTAPALSYNYMNASDWLMAGDPFFQTGGAGYGFKSAMDNDLTNYSQRVLGIPTDTLANKGLMQYVDFILYCQDTNGNMNVYTSPPYSWYCTPNNTCRVPDREWQAYRQFYFQAKQKYYNILIADTCGSKCQVGQPIVNPEPGSCAVATQFTVQLNTDPTVPPCGTGYQTVAVVYNGGSVFSNLAVTLYYPPNRDTGLPTSVTFNAGDSKEIICIPNDILVSGIKVNAVYCNGLPQYGNDPSYVVHLSDAVGGSQPPYCPSEVVHSTTLTLENAAGMPVAARTLITTRVAYAFYSCSGTYLDSTSYSINILPGNTTSAPFVYIYSVPCPCTATSYANIECISSLVNASHITGAPTCTGFTYSNPQGPPPSTCPPALAVKQPRFPQVTQTGGGETGYTDSSQFVPQIIAQIKQQGDDICTGNSDAWIRALQPGFTALGTSAATITSLRNALIIICEAGVDQTHPMGSSTEPPGGSPTYANFGAAIKSIILGGGAYTTQMNPWLIDSPYPYNVYQQSVPITISKSSTSLCTLLNTLQTLAGGSANLYNYLVTTYGAAMTLTSSDVSALQNSCLNCKFMLSHDITLPVFLDPKMGTKACITYSAYSLAKDTLITQFGGTLPTNDPNYPTILANYMNQKFGYSLAYDQYLAFEGVHSGSLCNQMPYATINADPYDCVKNQVQVLVANGIQDWNNYIATNRQAFISSYETKCSMAQENATMASLEQLYHYTLYYYDQADNLVRTVPPEGVNLVASSNFSYIDKARDADTSSVNYNVPNIPADQPTAMNMLSSVLSAAQGTVQLWLYNTGLTSYQFTATTPDNLYQFQANIASNTLSIDIWPKSGSSNWHFQADITTLQPLNPFVLIGIEGANLGTAPASVRVFLNGVQVTAHETTTTGAVVADNLTMLKHLRLYTHQLSLANFASDGGQFFFNASDLNVAGWYRFNIPAMGTLTTVNDTSTREQAYYDTYPAHGIPTTYIYNATNQVTQQKSPDGGLNRYWYDLLSRLVVSQNDNQNPHTNFSYTLYDTLGRITEVGQKNTSVVLGTPGYLSATLLNSFVAAGTNSQITDTYYDTPLDTVASNTNGIASIHTQNNLRKRVAASTYSDVQAGPVLRATYYTYDIDGNVSSLWQQLDGLYTPSTNAGLKRIDYEYDLVSDKVNLVRYQNNQLDAFFYAYSYDADNRVIAAATSNRAVVDTVTGSLLPPSISKLDARYYYYLHGPLRRMELGNSGSVVQGLDYAYTLQGWLKGVNSATGASYYDMGLDSATVAKDAFAYSLGYYNGDYTPIGGATYKAFTLQYSQATMGDITGQNLYNGNISNTTMAINQFGSPVGYTYAYDQLNRIKRMRQYTNIHGTSWSRANITQNYQENVSYDGNGNIQTYGRNGVYPTTAQTIDSLSYHYNTSSGKLVNNKLNFIADAISNSSYPLDLRNQTSANYQYDALGNLIKDVYAGITNVGWTVYNKPDTIYKSSGNLIYTYNTSNQRVSKTDGTTTSWYVRDAQGNVLSIYDNAHGNNNWREQHLYGSSRLGMWMPNMNMAANLSVAIWDTVERKQYELDNHLGNVMTTVTDKRLQHSSTGTTLDYFSSDIVNTQDYYPFGMLMPGRQYTFGEDSSYRYGFNSKENDNTIMGFGNSQDYGGRFYDVRIGRFYSVDPIAKKYPELSTYQFASNSPIIGTDLDGLECNGCTFGAFSEGAKRGENPMVGLKKAANTVFKIEKGTYDGVKTSLTNTWDFFTSDLWKGSTWKQFGHLFEEVGLSASPFSGIYNPNTPILDAGVQSFNDKVIHGDAYTRSKFGAQILTDIATAYVSSKGLGEIKAFGSRVVETAWDIRQQSTTVQAVAGYIQAKTGSTLYRLGTIGKSATGSEAQFWSLENPLTDPEAYAKKFNIPLENVRNANFIETANVKKGAKFITQEAGTAPGSANAGKGIEVVVEKGGTTNNVITPISPQP